MLIAGIVLITLAGVALFLARHQRGTSRAATATETMSCADITALATGVASEVGAGSFAQRCEVVGAAQAGPDGVQKGPDSGLEAVWTRTKVTHKYWEMVERTTDGRSRRVREEREEVVSENDSTTPFAIRDDSGEVLVHPDGADIDRPEQVLDRFDRGDGKATSDGLFDTLLRVGDDSGTVGFRHEEWIIRPGTRLYVQGVLADDRGALAFTRPTDKRAFLVSTRSEEEIVGEAERNAKIAVAVAAVAGLAGLVLVAAGLVA